MITCFFIPMMLGCFKCGEDGHMSRDCPSGGGRGRGIAHCSFSDNKVSGPVFPQQINLPLI